MKLRRVTAVARKEFLHVLRDFRSLAMAIAIPMLMLVMFGYALTLDVDHVPLVVWDQSQTPASRELISRFAGSRYFSLQGYVWDYRAVDQAIDSGEALVTLVVPRDFAAQLRNGDRAALQLIADGSDSNTATLAMNYAEAVVQTYSQDINLQEMYRRGFLNITVPLEPRARVWFNADLQSKNFIVPGLIAVIMMVIAAMLTSLTIAREWERGTMEQLISTPVTGPELIVGKLAPYFTIGLLDVLLSVVMGQFVFHVPLRGNLLLLFSMASIFLVGALSMGIVISIVGRTQLLASQMAMVATYLPAFLLSGFMVPIVNMPRPIQLVTYLVPARYFVAMLKAIYLKGTGVRTLWPEIVLLTVFGLVMVLIANLKFRKKLV